jgi:hypothetical protein
VANIKVVEGVKAFTWKLVKGRANMIPAHKFWGRSCDDDNIATIREKATASKITLGWFDG